MKILAYVYESELLCAEHGAEYDDGTDEGAFPIFESSEGVAMEWCSHGADYGHLFCMSCGSDIDGTRGAQDRDVEGHFARCWNCGAESVYVDGMGYVWTDTWGTVLDVCDVEVYGVTQTYATDGNGYTKITAVIDESTNAFDLQTFLVFLGHDPSAGSVLVLSTSWEDAFDIACEHFADEGHLMPPEGDENPHEDVECLDVSTDQVWFHTKARATSAR